jgi:hypothetical protein
VFINDDESGLHQDYDDWLEELAPHDWLAFCPKPQISVQCNTWRSATPDYVARSAT